eukprot:19963-Heterococcus_DN1.PRE.3
MSAETVSTAHSGCISSACSLLTNSIANVCSLCCTIEQALRTLYSTLTRRLTDLQDRTTQAVVSARLQASTTTAATVCLAVSCLIYSRYTTVCSVAGDGLLEMIQVLAASIRCQLQQPELLFGCPVTTDTCCALLHREYSITAR